MSPSRVPEGQQRGYIIPIGGAEAKAGEIMRRLDLWSKRRQKAASLTLPDRKRLAVARALATWPRILLLDAVMAGLRPTAGAARGPTPAIPNAASPSPTYARRPTRTSVLRMLPSRGGRDPTGPPLGAGASRAGPRPRWVDPRAGKTGAREKKGE